MAKKELWIADAIKPENKGKLRRKLHVKEGEDIPEKKLKKAEHSKNPTLRKEAVLAQTLRGLPRRGSKRSG